MAKVKGTVKLVGDGKFSKFVMLENRDGYYFNTKFDPKCGVGDVVGIEFESKGETRGNIKKLVLLEDNGAPKGVQEKKSSGGGGGGGGGRGDQGPSIVMQHSQEMGLRYVSILLQAEAIKLPAAAKREAFLSTLVDESTQRFYVEAFAPAAPAKPESAEKSEKPKSGGDDEWPEEGESEDKDDEWSSNDTWED
jgi:hypothetical protein